MKNLADLIVLPESIANMTEEEWAERDRRVAAARNMPVQIVVRDAVAEARKRGVPHLAADIVAAGLVDNPAVDAVREWDASAMKRGGILVLAGDKGTGKTVAAAWWAIASGARFMRASAFARASRYDAGFDALLAEPSLVIDDLGSEFNDGGGSFRVNLDELIDVTYSDYHRLIITTNCTADEFRIRYGERIMDRLRERGAWVGVVGESLRRAP